MSNESLTPSSPSVTPIPLPFSNGTVHDATNGFARVSFVDSRSDDTPLFELAVNGIAVGTLKVHGAAIGNAYYYFNNSLAIHLRREKEDLIKVTEVNPNNHLTTFWVSLKATVTMSRKEFYPVLFEKPEPITKEEALEKVLKGLGQNQGFKPRSWAYNDLGTLVVGKDSSGKENYLFAASDEEHVREYPNFSFKRRGNNYSACRGKDGLFVRTRDGHIYIKDMQAKRYKGLAPEIPLEDLIR